MSKIVTIGQATLYHGDCREVIARLEPDSIDSIVTDPPYGLSFMGNHWDYDVPAVDVWKLAIYILKPGAHMLAFSGTRTQHRMACAIEDAGFEIRDMIAWVYGSGFPKSLDVSKAIDKAAGALQHHGKNMLNTSGSTMTLRPHTKPSEYIRPKPVTENAKRWAGWGTALKPAMEPVTVARKPIIGTVAANVLEHGTGAINIDGCRVPGEPPHHNYGRTSSAKAFAGASDIPFNTPEAGRFPANLIHDGSDEVVHAFPNAPGQQGDLKGHLRDRQSPNGCFGKMSPALDHPARVETEKNASRFFYCAKANKKDRGEGNNHPTVKPTDLMRYLCRLVAPPGGIVLDPFMGSGSTGLGAHANGMKFIGIERERKYFDIACERIECAYAQQRLFA